jgi:hypothetical protein
VLSKPIKTPQYSLDAAGSIFLSGLIFSQMLAFASSYRKMLWQLTRRGTGGFIHRLLQLSGCLSL